MWGRRYRRIKRRRRRRRRAKLRVRKRAKEPNTGTSFRGCMFPASRYVEVGGGQFISVRGNYVHTADHLVMNNSSLENTDIQFQGDTKNPQRSRAMDIKRNSRPRSRDIYNRHMAGIDRGTPMWLTSPSSTHPVAYQRRGIAVGDVGVHTASGGFDFMFNIFLPANHPIHEHGLPEGFSPLTGLRSNDILKYKVFGKDSFLASASVEKSHDKNDSLGMTFKCSASEGAILTMPQGAYSEDFVNVARVRQYLSANKETWYKYVNNTCGREARNGDICLVTGCDMTSSWGIATYVNSMGQEFPLKFKPTGGSGYGWGNSGIVEARVGPDPEEMEELRSGDDSGHSGIYRNQCLFMRKLDATLSADDWQALGFDLEAAVGV